MDELPPFPVEIGDLVRIGKGGEICEVVEAAVTLTPTAAGCPRVVFRAVVRNSMGYPTILTGPDVYRLIVVRESLDPRGRTKHKKGREKE